MAPLLWNANMLCAKFSAFVAWIEKKYQALELLNWTLIKSYTKDIRYCTSELSNYCAPTDVRLLPVFSHSTHIFLHGCVRAHAVEEFVFLPVLLDDLPRALVMARKHSSHHYKVSPRTWGAKAERSWGGSDLSDSHTWLQYVTHSSMKRGQSVGLILTKGFSYISWATAATVLMGEK